MALLLPLILPVSVAHTGVTFQTQLWNWNNASDKYLFLLILSFKEIRPLCVAFTFWVSLSFVLVVFYTKHPDLFSRSFPSFVLLNCPAPRVSWFLMDKQNGMSKHISLVVPNTKLIITEFKCNALCRNQILLPIQLRHANKENQLVNMQLKQLDTFSFVSLLLFLFCA